MNSLDDIQMRRQMKCNFEKFSEIPVRISPQLLILWENSNEPWGVKDVDSKYVYVNRAYYDLLNIDPLSISIEGQFDDELPASIAVFARFFKEHDRSTIKFKDRLCTLEIHRYGKEQLLQPYFFDKFPLFDEKTGKCIGTIFHARRFENISLIKHINGDVPATFCFYPPVNIFSVGELDVIFFAMQSMSSKCIAKKLNLSHRTIENKLLMIYQKADVHSLSQLIEFCRLNGLDRYIPQRFFRPGSRVVTSGNGDFYHTLHQEP